MSLFKRDEKAESEKRVWTLTTRHDDEQRFRDELNREITELQGEINRVAESGGDTATLAEKLAGVLNRRALAEMRLEAAGKALKAAETAHADLVARLEAEERARQLVAIKEQEEKVSAEIIEAFSSISAHFSQLHELYARRRNLGGPAWPEPYLHVLASQATPASGENQLDSVRVDLLFRSTVRPFVPTSTVPEGFENLRQFLAERDIEAKLAHTPR